MSACQYCKQEGDVRIPAGEQPYYCCVAERDRLRGNALALGVAIEDLTPAVEESAAKALGCQREDVFVKMADGKTSDATKAAVREAASTARAAEVAKAEADEAAAATAREATP